VGVACFRIASVRARTALPLRIAPRVFWLKPVLRISSAPYDGIGVSLAGPRNKRLGRYSDRNSFHSGYICCIGQVLGIY